MTAEIAIINRSAVTLATDSAVTLSVRGAEKIYNCADKLFELSDTDPIGVMAYNNLEFMGIPLEVAIKQFRNRNAVVRYDSVFDAAEEFFKYLQNDLAADIDLQKQHARPQLLRLLSGFKREFERAAVEEYQKRKKNGDFEGIFTSLLKKRVNSLETKDVSQCFTDTSEAEVDEFYADVLDTLIKELFPDIPLTDKHKADLRRMCVLKLIRDDYSQFRTGLVFAGFGEHEMFPSLVAFEIDGIIFNKLKRRETERVKTSRSEISGEILPFAQREMVDRFLYGIDPQFETGIEQFLKGVIQATGKAVVQTLSKPTKATKEKLNKSVEAASDIALKSWREKMIPTVKNRFMQEVQDMIFLMPKQELAALAEELINLTSVKRKFSSGKESVGGPIDVAVLSRIDGFVWVKRKHYFEPNLNPRYFNRKFGHIKP